MANPTIDEENKVGRSNFGDGANILVIPADPQDLEADLPTGWGRGDTSSVTEQKYLAYSQEKAGDVTYDTVLLPQKMGVNDDVDIKRLDTGFDKSEVSALEITINNDVAQYIISHSHIDEVKTYGTSSYDGRMAFFEKNSYGQLKTVSISDGKMLIADGTEVIRSSNVIENLSISYAGKDMYLSTSNKKFSAEVYVPEGTENIYLNNTTATVQRNGNYALIGGDIIRPDGEATTENGEVKVKFDEAKYEKYLNINGESEKVYTLEIEPDTIATAGESYDGAIGLPFVSDKEVLIKLDYSVKFDKPIKITNFFNKSEKCVYVTQLGASELIPECEVLEIDEMLKSAPIVCVGNDYYTVYNLEEYRGPTEQEIVSSPLENTGPPDKTDSNGKTSENKESTGATYDTTGGNSSNSDGGDVIDSEPEDEPSDKISDFTDIIGHWAEAEIKELAENGILYGVGEELFAPNNTVTRAEFAAMIIRAMGIELIKYEDCFVDVRKTDWYADVLQTAKDYKIMVGFEGAARPTDNITREEAIKMLMTVCESYLGVEAPSETRVKFVDNAAISSWAYRYVEQAAALDIIKGDPEGRFNPHESATRAQAAAMLHRVLEIKK